MHTLSLFPSFFAYQMLGIFLLRVTLGFIFIYFWHEYRKIGHHKETVFSVAYLLLGVAGALFVIGLYTQGVAIATGSFMTIAAFMKSRKYSASLPESTTLYILLAITSFAFIFFGAGAFAIDLPL